MKKQHLIILIVGIVITGGIGGYYLLDGQQGSNAPAIAAGELQANEDEGESRINEGEPRVNEGEFRVNEGESRVNEGESRINEGVKTQAVKPPPVGTGNNSQDRRPEVDEKPGGVETAIRYTYRKGFRDPFLDYLPPENSGHPISVSTSTRRETTEKVNGGKAKKVGQQVVKAVEGPVKTGQVEIITPQTLRANLPFKLRGIVGSSQNWLIIIEERGVTRIYRTGELIREYKIIEIAADSLLLSYRSINFKLELRSGSGDR